MCSDDERFRLLRFNFRGGFPLQWLLLDSVRLLSCVRPCGYCLVWAIVVRSSVESLVAVLLAGWS